MQKPTAIARLREVAAPALDPQYAKWPACVELFNWIQVLAKAGFKIGKTMYRQRLPRVKLHGIDAEKVTKLMKSKGWIAHPRKDSFISFTQKDGRGEIGFYPDPVAETSGSFIVYETADTMSQVAGDALAEKFMKPLVNKFAKYLDTDEYFKYIKQSPDYVFVNEGVDAVKLIGPYLVGLKFKPVSKTEYIRGKETVKFSRNGGNPCVEYSVT